MRPKYPPLNRAVACAARKRNRIGLGSPRAPPALVPPAPFPGVRACLPPLPFKRGGRATQELFLEHMFRPGAWQVLPKMTPVNMLSSPAARSPAMIRPVRSRRAAGSTHLRCSQKFPWLVCTGIGRWERRAAAGLPPAAPREEDEESVSGGQRERRRAREREEGRAVPSSRPGAGRTARNKIDEPTPLRSWWSERGNVCASHDDINNKTCYDIAMPGKC